MDIRKLQRAIVDGLEDVKAQNLMVFNTEHLSPLFERVIIASGTSNRQTKALASSVRETVKGRGMQVMRCEGEDNGEWIIVDCGAAVVHIMQPAIRDYYHLEEIWGGKQIKLKPAETETKLVKASEDASKPAAKKAPTKKAAPAKRVAPAKRAPAVKPVAKKAAPAKKGVTKTTGVKKAAAPVKTLKVGAPTKKAAAAKKPAAKVAPASKAAVKKPAAKKTASKTSSKTSSKKA
ncbi:MAG: ribosome silencing factor [Paucibacter sp.]|nr:ribosome silencing factor [Roseateles sp.]